MSGVNFAEEPSYSPKTLQSNKAGSLFLRMGWAKTEKESLMMQVSIIVLSILIMGGVWIVSSSSKKNIPYGPVQNTIVPGPDGSAASNLHSQ